ncbi:hypothetical protein ACQKWADRAFT_306929 [Trichoderma austrokoningii]
MVRQLLDHYKHRVSRMMSSYFGLLIAVRSLPTMSGIELGIPDRTHLRSTLRRAARNDFNPVAIAILDGIHPKLGILRLPVRKRANADLQDKYGRAPLTCAVWNGYANLVQILIDVGARADLGDELEGTPLSDAFCNGNVEIINLFAKEKHLIDIWGLFTDCYFLVRKEA